MIDIYTDKFPAYSLINNANKEREKVAKRERNDCYYG